jgi:hypothetical protein
VPIALVQLVAKSTGATPAASLSIGAGDGWATPSAGNKLIVFATGDDYFTGAGSPPAAFTARVNQGAGSNCGSLCADKTSAGTETTITVTPATTASTVMIALEYSGMGAFDKASTPAVETNQVSTAKTAPAFGTATVDPIELIFAVWSASTSAGGVGATWSGQTLSFVELANDITTNAAGSNAGLCVAVLTSSSTGTFGPAATPDTATAGVAFQVAYRVAAAAGVPLNPAHLHKVPVHRAAAW